jgi:hypothetical protein
VKTSLIAVLALVGCTSSDGSEANPDPIVDSDTTIDTAIEQPDVFADAPIDTTTDVVEEAEAIDTALPTFDIHHVLGTGQSLSVGAAGAPALSTMQPYSNLMFSKGVIPGGTGLDKFAPLVEASVETLSSAFANSVTKDTSQVFLISAHGVGGTAYSGLKKGTTPFANGMAQVKAAKALADLAKKTYVVGAVTNVHGESDHVSGNMMYEANLAQWQFDYETDAKAITGQTSAIPMLHTQMSSWTKYGQATSVIPQAQLSASQKSGGKIVLVGPKYTSLYVSDGVHLSNIGYRVLGEYYAKAYKRILAGGTWTPLQPRAIKREGSTITVDFQVPVPPLEFDTTEVTNPGNYGFEVIDDGKPAKILIVSLASTETVKITLAAAPVGKNMRLRYAYTGTAGANGGPKTGPRGNLRDSDSAASAYAPMKLFNWCVHFDEPIP